MSIDKLKHNYPVEFRWIHFPLHPETPREGKSLAELFAGRDIEPMRRHMQQLMAAAGLPYGDRTHTYNSRLAQELGKWADTQAGGGEEGGAQGKQGKRQGKDIHTLLYQAYFFEARNIGDIDVLLDIAVGAGLDREAARDVLENRRFQAAVDADWARARASGITGVPTFTSQDLMVVGCQPYEQLERFVQHLLAQQNPQ